MQVHVKELTLEGDLGKQSAEIVILLPFVIGNICL